MPANRGAGWGKTSLGFAPRRPRGRDGWTWAGEGRGRRLSAPSVARPVRVCVCVGVITRNYGKLHRARPHLRALGGDSPRGMARFRVSVRGRYELRAVYARIRAAANSTRPGAFSLPQLRATDTKVLTGRHPQGTYSDPTAALLSFSDGSSCWARRLLCSFPT